MTVYIGKHAVVIGAGMAGLAAAGALADWFENVVILERDTLPDEAIPRVGTPQAEHAHGLLVGGLQALEALFPGLSNDFARAGAVPMRVNQDLREEWPDRDPLPQRDFGLAGYLMSRPLIEFTVRQRVLRRSNVVFRPNCRALSIAADDAGRRVTAVRCMTGADDCSETLPADVVVDASGRGHFTTLLLQAIGRPQPHEIRIGIDLGYTTAVMSIPDDAPSDWKMVLTHPNLPGSTRLAVLLPMEGNRWIMTVGGQGADHPPGEWDTLLAYLRQLATPTIYNAVRDLKPIGKLRRYALIESVWRHFAAVEGLPDGLIPIGDTICRFNPVYGQGMTVASKEAKLLHRLLEERASETEPLAGLGQTFLAEARHLIETPWTMAAIPDFASPATRGERPVDLEQSLRFATALSRIAERDAAVHRPTVEVWHMLKPRSVYQDPELVRRVQAELATA